MLLVASRLALLVAILASTAVSLTNTAGINDRLSAAQHTTCLVQKRGLAGQQHLTQAMADLVVLLVPSGRKIPAGQQAAYRVAQAMRSELASYIAIEALQPKRRDCS